jgi:uncharacterized protein (DUF2236 family)
VNTIRKILLPALTAPARARLRSWVLSVLQRGEGPSIDYDAPLGDHGLFGPDCVTWRIHSDFPGMMAGGVCALMLQTLHPLALAGVWDHSSFRSDILGRLRRTTTFVAATTYAPTAAAERLIARVRGIHGQVTGFAEDGRAYEANDPRLLTWVHTTEMLSFLRGYQRYRNPELPRALQDRYFAETSRIAEALGAEGVPKSVAEVDAYFSEVQPSLTFGARSAAVLEVLAGMALPIPLAGVSRHLFLGAGAALLPMWAQQLIPRPRLQRLRDEAAARSLNTLGPVFRAALKEGVAARSCRRVGVEPTILQHF